MKDNSGGGGGGGAIAGSQHGLQRFLYGGLAAVVAEFGRSKNYNILSYFNEFGKVFDNFNLSLLLLYNQRI